MIIVKKSKRILSLILSVLLILSAIPSNVFAISSSSNDGLCTPIEFTVTDVKGVTNKTVHVEVRVSENSQIASLGLELHFDSSKLLVVDYQAGDVLSGGLSAINGNISDKVILSFVTMEPLTEGGTLFGVDFDVTTTDINDLIDMYVTVTEITDINGDELPATAAAGTVEVVDLLYGDINFDNKITSLDALMLLSVTTEEIGLGPVELQAGDVNGDGEVTVSDALQILYFSAEMVEDFQIYHLQAPSNLHVSNLDGYQFTVEWDYSKDVLGYNVYLNGEQVNSEILTQNSIAIGVDMNGEYGSDLVPHRIQDKIEQVTTYRIEVTAINALKESDKCAVLPVTTRRIWSWVTFNDWDGRLIKKARVYYGEDAIEPGAPSREDYFFIGWDKPTTNIIDDTVITAVYEDAHYDFIFLDEDGTELYRQNVTVNGKATPPADPTKTGYSFAGWYTAASGGTKVEDFTITSATGERIVYAQYTINSYPVLFDSNGGSSVNSKTAIYLTTITAPESPTRLGYGFGGWYKDKNCTNKWNFKTDVITAETTLYAKWNPVVITIDKPTVTLNEVGETAQLTATITGGSDTLEWSSSNDAVAIVDQNGKITAKGHGTATIYVKGTSSERRPVTLVTVNVAKDAWVTGTGSSLSIRSKPTTSSSVIGSLRDGDKVVVLGEMQAPGVSGQKGWYQIKTTSGNGYVSADYITFTKPVVSNNGTLTGSFAEKLSYLRNTKFPHGKFWNHYANANHNHNGIFGVCTNSSCQNPDGYTNSPCSSHWGTVNTGGYDCNYFDGSIQCMGFARKVFYDVWGQYASSAQTISPSFENIKAGDYLRIDGDTHSVFVIEKGTNYIKTVECNFCYQDKYGNWKGTSQACMIKWDVVRYKGNFTITQIKRAR